jgi:hypothetical protein
MGYEELKATLEAIAVLLEQGQDSKASWVRKALVGSEEDLTRFLMSNELWGGAGSIADEGVTDNTQHRSTLERLLTRLGKDQLAQGNANERTESWISAFEQWSQR